MAGTLSTLEKLFKPGTVLVPRASLNHGGWMTRNPTWLEAMAGAQLLIKGALPILLHRDSHLPEHLALYEDWMEIDKRSIRSYGDEAEYQALLREVSQAEGSVVVQHRYPETELRAGACLVPPGLLGELNDKARLADWVPASHVLPRRVMRAQELEGEEPREWPQVLKASGGMTSGGGADVRICRDRAHWTYALADFQHAEVCVWEEYRAPRQILGVQFAVHDSGEILDLGCTENELKADGYVHGNWIDAATGASPEMVSTGREIMEKAARVGYRGVAGIDFLVEADGRNWVIDLNFRGSAGTPALLMAERVRREWKCGTLFSTLTPVSLPREQVFALLREGMKRQWWLPLGGYFPESGADPMVSLLFTGNDRAEVNARRAEWERRCGKRRRGSWWRRALRKVGLAGDHGAA